MQFVRVISPSQQEQLNRGNYEITIRTPGQFSTLEQIQETIVAIIEGVPVKMRDIASVEDTSQKVTRIVRVNGHPGVYLAVTKQSGKNTVEVATKVLEEVKRINREFKQIQIIPIIDNSDFIRRSISSVKSSVLYGGLFAILVLLFFSAKYLQYSHSSSGDTDFNHCHFFPYVFCGLYPQCNDTGWSCPRNRDACRQFNSGTGKHLQIERKKS